MTRALPYTFNPRENTPEVLEAMLVGRDDILGELQEDLERQIGSSSRQHWLIRGPRGMGKTHLIGVLYHRVLRDERLSVAYLPVWLAENASYETYSSGMLMLAVARCFVEQLEERRDDAVPLLRASLAEITHGGDDPALFEESCRLVREEARRRGRILLVLMENLDALLEGFAKQRSAREAGKLRALLSEDREFLFISTTPTRYLRKLSAPGSPLYGHLRERRLRPLREDELRELFERLSRLTGRVLPPGAELGAPEWALRWRVLHHLAGGNPRAGVIAFTVLTGASGIQAMVEELTRLLDLNTAYYEARLARLAPRERAIVTALAQAPTNLTIREISSLSRLPERPLPTQVKRLELEGHVAVAGGDKGKGATYELTDGLFRAWYQFRSGRRQLLPLVHFLAMWHAPEELDRTLSSLLSGKDAFRSAFERQLAELTELQVRSATEYLQSDAGRRQREALWAQCFREVADAQAGELERHLRELRDSGRVSDAEAARRLAEGIVGSLVTSLLGADSPEALELAAQVNNAGVLLRLLGSYQEAAAALRGLIERYGASEQPALQEQVARAMFNLGVALGEEGQPEQAMATYREVIDRYGASPQPALQKPVASAMVNLGITLGLAGQPEQETATYRQVIERCGASPWPDLQEEAAMAMAGLGAALVSAGQLAEAVATLGELIKRFGSRTEPFPRTTVGVGALILAGVLGELGRHEEAARTASQAVDSLVSAPPSEAQVLLAHAHLRLATELYASNRPAQARMALLEAADVAAKAASVPVELARQLIVEATLRLRLEEAEQAIEKLAGAADSAVAELSRLHRFVLSVLRAEEPPRRGERKEGPAARRSRALRRVPPEVRQSVIEAVEGIKAARAQDAQPGRGQT
jgi:tetratricopeptide (TPR) repeat protein